jgi:cytochrome c peroxidase
MRRCLSLCFIVLACQSTPQPTPAPKPVAVVAQPAPPPTPPAPPPVVLEPAPPLPAALLGVPAAPASAENPLTAEKAHLGWLLFYEPKLSKDGSMACAQCHHLDKAFTSGNTVDTKVGGAVNKRNSPSMFNLAAHSAFYWDGRAPTIEAVSLAAWKGQLGADPAAAAEALKAVPTYQALFARAFAGQAPTAENVPQALASFFRTLQSGNAPFDRFMNGDTKAISKEAQAGWAVFQKSGCIACHVPPFFSNFAFHHVGIGNDDPGRKDATKADADLGKFKTPSLRNVALTAPYFHDGSSATLTDAITAMAQGGRAGPLRDPALKPQKLAAKDIALLKAFLESLTGDSTYTTQPTLP